MDAGGWPPSPASLTSVQKSPRTGWSWQANVANSKHLPFHVITIGVRSPGPEIIALPDVGTIGPFASAAGPTALSATTTINRIDVFLRTPITSSHRSSHRQRERLRHREPALDPDRDRAPLEDERVT